MIAPLWIIPLSSVTGSVLTSSESTSSFMAASRTFCSATRRAAAALTCGAAPPCLAQTVVPGIRARPHRRPVRFDVAVHRLDSSMSGHLGMGSVSHCCGLTDG